MRPAPLYITGKNSHNESNRWEWAPIRDPLFLCTPSNRGTDMSETDWLKRLRTETGLAARVAEVVEPVIEDLGFRLVRVRITGERGANVQVFAEREDGTLTIEDCVEITRVVSPLLDVEDPMPSAYNLEVSSPGIDRVLVRPVDFERYAGFEARIELSEPIGGQRRFRGHIEGFADGEVRLETEVRGYDEPQVIGLPFDDIHEARLVMSDDLLKASAPTAASRKLN